MSITIWVPPPLGHAWTEEQTEVLIGQETEFSNETTVRGLPTGRHRCIHARIHWSGKLLVTWEPVALYPSDRSSTTVRDDDVASE